jgi:hypothetical protein
MRLELGSPVRCADERFGELADVVIDPAKRPVTHLVVTPRQRYRPARLVPIELVKGEHDAISLRCTLEEADALEPIQSGAYLRWGEAPLDDPGWDVGIETVLAPPYSPYSAYGQPARRRPPHLDPLRPYPEGRGRDPARERRHVCRRRLGHVDGFLVDGDDALTHVVLERGHLFGRRDVTIPIDAVARVATDSVTLGLTKDEVALLPAVRVLR